MNRDCPGNPRAVLFIPTMKDFRNEVLFLCDLCDLNGRKSKMPIVDKRDRNSWYNSIPTAEDPSKKWEHFSADKLQGNEIRCGSEILAKIPEMTGLISYKNRENQYGGVTRYVELITERRYDPEKKQCRNKRVCIGIDISHIYRGMMVINDKYHQYFNKNGELIFTPRIEEKKVSKPPLGIIHAVDSGTNKQAEEQKKEEEQMDENDRKIQEELKAEKEQEEHIKDRFEFLSRLLEKYKFVVDEQLNKKQDRMMSRYQIRRINELLEDIREFMQVFEYGEYLQIAEEPTEDGESGMTYSDMAILLKGYECVMDGYRFGRLWYKG